MEKRVFLSYHSSFLGGDFDSQQVATPSSAFELLTSQVAR